MFGLSDQKLHPLQTPHSGYQWDNRRVGFFEGWYFRVTLPEAGVTFAFMYSIQDPIGGQVHSGGLAQVLGPGDGYTWRSLPNPQLFWAWSAGLGLGHWRQALTQQVPQWLPPNQFGDHISEGYQATSRWHQGCLQDPTGQNTVTWQYQTEPVYGWGQPQQPQQATAGWLSNWSIFEPGWQVLMAHGYATGWIEWQRKRYHFTRAPAYCEKNWGRSFPQRWFWLQCNAFNQTDDLSLTAVGTDRQGPYSPSQIALIGVHHQNQFYEFVPWNATFTWQVDAWGDWYLRADRFNYRVELKARAHRPGVPLRTPAQEGMVYRCRHTTQGQIRLNLWYRQRGGLILLLRATSHQAALEVGGDPWSGPWCS